MIDPKTSDKVEPDDDSSSRPEEVLDRSIDSACTSPDEEKDDD